MLTLIVMIGKPSSELKLMVGTVGMRLYREKIMSLKLEDWDFQSRYQQSTSFHNTNEQIVSLPQKNQASSIT